LQATIFRNVYEWYGDLLHRRGAFLLEGRVENTSDTGFSFVVKGIEDLREALTGTTVPTSKAMSVTRAFRRAGRRGRKAG
jgi:hypothetical protein